MQYPPYELERRAQAFNAWLDTVHIWKYPVRDKTVNVFRVPRGSRLLWATKDKYGRHAYAFGVPDPLAEYESRYFVRVDESTKLKLDREDKRLTSVEGIQMGNSAIYCVYEAQAGHPVVVQHCFR